MNTLDAITTLENGTDNELEYYQAMQATINAGQWGLQGSFGRAMMESIEAGKCMLGPEPARDYYGNFIPSRTMVKNGTKGSKLYVSRASGRAWSNRMAEVR